MKNGLIEQKIDYYNQAIAAAEIASNNKYKKDIIENKEWGFGLPLIDLSKCLVAFTSPQSYGPRLENFLKRKLQICHNKGYSDCIDQYNIAYEIKVSILTHQKSLINVVQIRPWQETQYYILVIDLRNYKQAYYDCFKLTKEQMIQEGVLLKWNNAHIHKKETSNNAKVEKRFSMKIENEDYTRWCSQYKVHYNL